MHIIYRQEEKDHSCFKHMDIIEKPYYELSDSIFDESDLSNDTPPNISVLIRDATCKKCSSRYKIVENSYLFCVFDSENRIVLGYINTD